jgi:hypothetical protein
LGTLIAQLNAWAPQIELQVQQVLGAAMVAEGRVQQLSEGGAAELTNIVAAFRNELDMRTASRLASDDVLKEELRAIVSRVHVKFVEVEAAMERMRQDAARAATSMPTTTTPTTRTSAPGASGAAACGGDANPDPWAAAAAAARQGVAPAPAPPPQA